MLSKEKSTKYTKALTLTTQDEHFHDLNFTIRSDCTSLVEIYQDCGKKKNILVAQYTFLKDGFVHYVNCDLLYDSKKVQIKVKTKKKDASNFKCLVKAASTKHIYQYSL